MLPSDLKSIVGLACNLLQYAVIVIGLTHQILLIRRTRSSKSVSIPFFGLSLASCVLWLAYGYLARDLYIMLPQFLGIVAGVVLLFYIFRYRSGRKPAV